MIKRLITVALFFALAAIHAAAQAQPNRFPPINLVAGDPTGTACPANSIVQSSTSGILYSCQGGAYRMPGGTSIPPTMVTWPPSCTAGTYVPATNTCVPTGTAANPGGSPGQTQINAGGGTFVGIPGSATDPTFGWKTQGGTQYAQGWQSGAGNNGIANAQASLQTVVSDPSYAATEAPTTSTFTATPVHWQDLRFSMDSEYFRNAGSDATGSAIYANRFGAYGSIGKRMNCMWDTNYGGSTTNSRDTCATIDLTHINPGFNIGNNWQGAFALMLHNTGYSSGILQSINLTQTKNGTGDNIGEYCYVYGQGGFVDGGGEQSKCFAGNVQEQYKAYAGTAVGSGTNPITITTTPLAAYANLQGTGRYLINRGACGTTGSTYPATCAAPPFSGTVTSTAASAVDTTGLTAVTISGTVTPSNAWGKLTGNCNTGQQSSNPPFSTSVTCAITTLSGTWDTTHLICFDGQNHDCAIPTAASPTSITIPLRHLHNINTFLFQGGMAGYGLEYVANTTINGGGGAGNLQSQPLRFLYDVFGSTSANTLQVGSWSGGAVSPLIGNPNQFFNISPASMSSVGTLVTFTYQVSGSTYSPGLYAGSSAAITNTDGAAMDGTCTNIQPLTGGGANVFTCTNAALTGTHANATNTPVGTLIRNGVPLNTYNIWPMAEVLDVRNNTVNPPVVDGTLALEPNVLGTINSGDVLEEPHHQSARVGATTNNVFSFNADSSTYVFAGTAQGAGMCCGTTSLASNALMALKNFNPDSIYQGLGGSLLAPNLLNAPGYFTFDFLFDHAPVNSLIYVQPTASQTGNPLLTYSLLSAQVRSGINTALTSTPYFGDAALQTARMLTLTGSPVVINSDLGSQTFRGQITMAAIAAPTLTVTCSTTGGSLAAGTYFYQVQARGAATYSPRSTEASGTVASGTTGSCLLSWTAVAGASVGYYPSGRATGTETNFTVISGIASTVWRDDGSQTPAGAAFTPVGPSGVDQAGFIGLNSSGTAFELKLQAPASMAATTTITVTKITTISITPAAVTASTCAEQTFNTYTGLATGQIVTVSPPAFLGAHVWIASTRVSAANTLAIAFCADATGGTPVSGIYSAMAF